MVFNHYNSSISTIDNQAVFCYYASNTNFGVKLVLQTKEEIMLGRNNGATLVELSVVMATVGILVVSVLAISCGNFWYSDDSVLRELKANHPKVTEVLKAKRNIFAESVITVKEDGVDRDYCLDTNILWNYEFSECQK